MVEPSPLNDYMAHLTRHGVELNVSPSVRHDDDVTGSSLASQSSPRDLEFAPDVVIREHHADGIGASHATMTLGRTLCQDCSIDSSTRMIELGSGTGVLSMAAAFRGASVTSVELNSRANDWARRNFRNAKLPSRIVEADILSGSSPRFSEKFDLMVANLPHKPVPNADNLPLANNGGPDGTSFYQAMLPIARNILTDQGEILFLLHSLPSSQALLNMQEFFSLTVCAWRIRFLGHEEYPTLVPYWLDREEKGQSFLHHQDGRHALVFCVWHAKPRQGTQ